MFSVLTSSIVYSSKNNFEKQIDEKAFTQLEVQTNDLPWSETSGSSDVTPEAPVDPAPDGGGE